MPIKSGQPNKQEKLHNPFRVLVTGFEPFSVFSENPSWEAVKALQDEVIHIKYSDVHDRYPIPSNPRPIHISVLQIPVVYNAVLDLVPRLHGNLPILPPSAPSSKYQPQTGAYDFILHVGVGDEGDIAVESLAHKLGYFMADNEGKCPAMCPSGKRGFSGEIYNNLPDELTTNIDVSKLVKDIKGLGIDKISVSTDPGHYLCDFIYYCSLAAQTQLGSNSVQEPQVLFLHCPPVDKPLSTEEVTTVIKRVVTWVSAQQQLLIDG